MADTLQTFPKNSIEALALLYLQNQDLSGHTPEELVELFYDAQNRIAKQIATRRS